MSLIRPAVARLRRDRGQTLVTFALFLLVLVLFGGSQLPKLARGLGSAQREFKKGLAGDGDDKPASEKPKSD